MSSAKKPALNVQQAVWFRGCEQVVLRLDAAAETLGVSMSEVIRRCVGAHLPVIELQAALDPKADRVLETRHELDRDGDSTGRLIHVTAKGRKIFEGERAENYKGLAGESA